MPEPTRPLVDVHWAAGGVMTRRPTDGKAVATAMAFAIPVVRSADQSSRRDIAVTRPVTRHEGTQSARTPQPSKATHTMGTLLAAAGKKGVAPRHTLLPTTGRKVPGTGKRPMTSAALSPSNLEGHTTVDTTDDRRARLAAAWAGAGGDIRRAVAAAEDWDEEWAAYAIYSDGTRRYAGRFSYVGTGPAVAPFRGNARRMPTQERALTVANAIKTHAETHPAARIRPKVVEVGAELIKTRTAKIGVSE